MSQDHAHAVAGTVRHNHHSLSPPHEIQGGLIPATQGLKWGLDPRNEPREKSALQGRITRIIVNHIESMLMVAPLILIFYAADAVGRHPVHRRTNGVRCSLSDRRACLTLRSLECRANWDTDGWL